MWNFFVAQLVLLSLVLQPLVAVACSAFGSPKSHSPFLSKSYDWFWSEGVLATNRRGLEKTAVVLEPPLRPVSWVSKYGSITFNQFGLELPNGGLNEKGLAVEILWFANTRFPTEERLPTISEAQWIQYQLDLSATIPEMIENAKKIQVRQVFAPVHYFACDASGGCAGFAYINGELKIHTGEELPYRVFTNTSYEYGVQYARDFEGFGGEKKIPMEGFGTKARFVRLAHLAKSYPSQGTSQALFDYSFGMLESVKAPLDSSLPSQWSIVYDLKNREIQYKRWDLSTKVKKIRLSEMDFSCRSQRRVFDMDRDIEGELQSYFQPSTGEINEKILRRANSELGYPEEVVQKMLRYPKELKCAE